MCGHIRGNDVEEFERRVNMFKIPCPKFLKINKMKKISNFYSTYHII